MLRHFSPVQLCATLWTVSCQVPLFMGFSRQEYWSGSPLPSPGDLPNPGIKPMSLVSPALAGGFFTTRATWEAPYKVNIWNVVASNDNHLFDTWVHGFGLAQRSFCLSLPTYSGIHGLASKGWWAVSWGPGVPGSHHLKVWSSFVHIWQKVSKCSQRANSKAHTLGVFLAYITWLPCEPKESHGQSQCQWPGETTEVWKWGRGRFVTLFTMHRWLVKETAQLRRTAGHHVETLPCHWWSKKHTFFKNE